MSNIQTVLGNNIRRLRNQRGWSQVFLADKLAISVSFVSVVESGQRGVSLALVEEIADAFSVPVPYLFTDHDSAQESGGMNLARLDKMESELRESVDGCITAFFSKQRKAQISKKR